MSSSAVTSDYIGRFAPSPTGDLHLGSLLVAVATQLQARRAGGQWLLRIEDIDPPRVVAGAASRIECSLRAHGLNWDGEVLHQSTRFDHYQQIIDQLLASGDAYWCGCTRAELPADGVYPGTCRDGLPAGKKPRAVRLRVSDRLVTFTDAIQGRQQQQLCREVGDFVIRRADGLPAYQLAVVVDDAEQGVTEVVRGADLLDSTPRQIDLQHRLGYPQPDYLHLPLLIAPDGRKLSKQNFSDPLDNGQPLLGLFWVMSLLGHPPAANIANLEQFWRWAGTIWDPQRVPRRLHLHLGAGDKAVILANS
ncbi:MAG: tRNA glutamyl-Q(34) synthetase GluQRS [Wenzhouxiangellaceae bacterium]